MCADVPFEITLSSVPATAPASGEAKVHGSATPAKQQAVSPVGVYVQHYRRRLESTDPKDQSDHLKAHSDHVAAETAKAMQNMSLADDEEEEEDEELLLSDPKEWKKQDHYAILGLSKLRYRATLDDIIKNQRKKVLRHHPDKKAAQGHMNDDGFFKCIQKAFEILTDPVKRRQYDSVDTEISTEIPSAKDKGADFYETYRPVFEREARFSNIQPVPGLGDENSSREDVEAFYAFWYEFDSWRSFEYLDKDVADGNGNRDEKRYIEGKNRKERANRKKEDTQRLRTLVENAMKADQRMVKFKEEDKLKRNAKRNAREEESRKAAEAKKAAEEAAKKAAAESAVQEEELKKQRQQAHKQLKKEQRALKVFFKTANYFVPEGTTPSAADITAATDKLDKIIAAKHDLDKTVEIRTEIEKAHAAGNGLATVDEIVSKL
ncbi:Zuotin [Coemansia sp. RSA 1813]|nr:Zuotin [Coemansia sp. RSA 1646]KAJ1769601.1 Zuotin [Coemansia sp. RSA 1843]KAJ2088451.1 Zuotin [Coemansia sp. RSA 986]KAJ2213545.1 Zuotin [Coemansia sp. RSA 487]KAJ2568966.1 Zuotin [Coemansia sp. RSA 1813]